MSRNTSKRHVIGQSINTGLDADDTKRKISLSWEDIEKGYK